LLEANFFSPLISVKFYMVIFTWKRNCHWHIAPTISWTTNQGKWFTEDWGLSIW